MIGKTIKKFEIGGKKEQKKTKKRWINVTEGRLRNIGSCSALSYDAYSHD